MNTARLDWKDVYRNIKQMVNEAYEQGQMDVRRKLMAKMNSVYPNETFTRTEIEKYLEET